MFDFAENIKPLLVELDDVVPLHDAVPINVLIELVKKHSCYRNIEFGETKKESVIGAHIAFPNINKLLIYYRPCSVHNWSNPQRSCPECKTTRFIIAKELSHAFDCDDEKTSRLDAEEMLIKECLQGSYGNKQAQADLFGSLWGTELLVRYMHRAELSGSGVLAENQQLSSARSTGDYSYFSEQFCVPPKCVELCFRESTMKAMKAVRKHVGLPILNGGFTGPVAGPL